MATEATSQAEEKITFDDRQQEKINQLIREKQGEAAREVRQELADAKRTIERLEAQLKEDNADGIREELEKLHADRKVTMSENERLRKVADDARDEVTATRKQAAIHAAAAKSNFIDVGTVHKLTADNIRYDADKKRYIVLDETGNERLGSNLEPLTLDTFYEDYAAKNPFLVRPSIRPGSGSVESQSQAPRDEDRLELYFGKSSSGQAASDLMRRDPQKYHRLRRVARERGLLA